MRYEIELINQTDYHTRAIRKILREMMRECGITELRCELYYSRQCLVLSNGLWAGTRSYGVMGWGGINRPHISIGLPNTFEVWDANGVSCGRERFDPQQSLGADQRHAFVREIAATVYHEIGHTLGLRHGDMSREMMHPDRNTPRFDCVDGITFTRRAI
jgi:hypothetical protein